MKTDKLIGSLETKQNFFVKMMIIVFCILLVVASFYAYQSYADNQEKKVSIAVNSLLGREEGIVFEKDSLAYEEELLLLAGELSELYEQKKRSLNAKRGLFHAGLINFRLGNYAESRELFDRLLEDKKFFLSPQIYMLKAQSYELEGEYNAVLLVLDEYEQYYAGTYFQNEVKLLRARNLSYLERYDEARELYQFFTDASKENTSKEKNIPEIYINQAKEALDGFKLLGISEYTYDDSASNDQEADTQ